MASIVRAGPMNVDCSEAAEEARTHNDMRIANGPMTGPASAAKMFSWMSALPIPNSSAPVPEKDRTASAIVRYRTTMTAMVDRAALPGVVRAPCVSSFIVRTTSQPQ